MSAATACGVNRETTSVDLTGASVEVVAVWQDTEAAAFEDVLESFETGTGATVTFTSTAGQDLTSVLDRRLAAGDPPDLAVLPQPGLLQRYAQAGHIEPIEELVGDLVAANWPTVWQELGTVGGELYGVWFKAANKSLIWYSLAAFEDAGLVPPDDLQGLVSVAETLEGRGTPAFSLTGAPSDAWTVTDWFENLYLRIAGPERYDALAKGALAWTHPSVARTLEAMAELLRPGSIIRVDGAETTFPASVAAVFDPDPAAAMLMEGDFVPGVVPTSTVAEVGVDVDVFPFPGSVPSDRFVVGGGDAVVLMRPSTAAEALLRYLASADAATAWASRGGFISPNESVDLAVYPTAAARRIARALLEAGDEFRFDLSDLQPVAFGGTTDAALWTELERFLDERDTRATMNRIEDAARKAWDAPG